MRDLADLQPEEQVQVLMDLLEDQQTEIEKKDKIIQEQKTQVSELLDLNEKLNNENSEENVQALKNDLKQAKQQLQTEKENVIKANGQIGDIQDKLVKMEKEKDDAIRNQRVVEIPVEKMVFYEKCRSCDQTALKKTKSRYEQESQKLQGKYRMKEAAYDGALMGFILYSILVTVFMAIRSTVFRTDFIGFFMVLWNGIITAAKAILWIGKTVSAISSQISNETLSVIVHWIIFLIVIGVMIAGLVALFWFIIGKVNQLYREYCWDKISLIVFAISLANVVFFGDRIRLFLQINLLLILLLVQVGYVIVRWYVKGCRENRRY